ELLHELESSLQTLQTTVTTLKEQSKQLTQSVEGVETQFRLKFESMVDELIKKATNQINDLNKDLVEFCNKNYEIISDQTEKMDNGVSQSFRAGLGEFMEKVGEHMGHIGESRSYAINTAYKHLETLGSEIGDRNVDLIKNIINEMDNALHRTGIDLDEYADRVGKIQSAMSKAAIGEVRKSIGKAVESLKTILDKISGESGLDTNTIKVELEKIRNELALSYTTGKDLLKKMVNDAESEMSSAGSQIRGKTDETRTEVNKVLTKQATESGTLIASKINEVYQQMESDILAVFEAYIDAVELFRDSVEDASLTAAKPLIETLDKEREALLTLLDTKREEIELELSDVNSKLESFSKSEVLSSLDQIKTTCTRFIEDTEATREDLNKKASDTLKMLESVKKKVSESKALLTQFS
ncbi:MAG: hypothetical protein ACFFDT_04540, partial [Candidatus Hodarchaeota archaeon]